MKKATRADFVGIDVAMAKLDVHFHVSGAAFTVSNDDDGVSLLAVIMLMRHVQRVVLESTGPYGRRLIGALLDVGVAVNCVQPQRVRKFAEALGIKAKTDVIDARVIAHFAATATFPTLLRPSPAVLRLNDLVVRRSQLVEMETMERNHIRSSVLTAVEGAEDLLPVLRKNIRALDSEMKRVVDADPDLTKRAGAIRTIPPLPT